MEERIRILLVEDDKVDQMAFERFVEREALPYDYVVAGSVSAAREVLTDAQFDAALLDYSLGDGTAFDLFDEIRDTPIVIITGSGDEEIAVEAIKAGVSDYLVKDPEGNYLKTLPVTVENAIRRRRAEEELRQYRERLEELVAERTAELTRANKQLVAEIAERKQAEEALRESERRFRSIAETASDAIVIFDSQENIFYWNRAAQTIFGYQVEETRNRLLVSIIPEQFQKVFREEMERIVTARVSDGGGKAIEMMGIRKDDSEFPLELSLATWSIEDNTFFTAIVRDITERKQIEKQLRQQERLAAIGQLAGGIAHDFNNLMATIILSAHLSLAKEDLPPATAQTLKVILSESRRAAKLVQQILDFSRRSTMETRPVNLASFTEEVVGVLQRTIPENIHLTLKMEPEEYAAADRLSKAARSALTVEADPTRIQQVLMNLVLNARDAMPEGGELHASLSRIALRPEEKSPVAEMGPGEWVCLTVSDTGTGIPPDVLPHIYEPFFTTKERGEGTGPYAST